MQPFSFFKKIILFAWMTSLLVSTAGVSVHRVYCFCKNEQAISFFVQPTDGCEKSENEAQNCCAAVPKTIDCCQQISKKEGQKHSCTDRSSTFSKLETKFLATDFLVELPDFQLVTSVSELAFGELLAVCPIKIARSGNASPPPRPAGRALLILVNNFRC